VSTCDVSFVPGSLRPAAGKRQITVVTVERGKDAPADALTRNVTPNLIPNTAGMIVVFTMDVFER